VGRRWLSWATELIEVGIVEVCFFFCFLGPAFWNADDDGYDMSMLRLYKSLGASFLFFFLRSVVLYHLPGFDLFCYFVGFRALLLGRHTFDS
jgi:hypothetical protein